MNVDTQTQAILMLTAHLGKVSQGIVKPLSPVEWGRFAGWLHSEGKRPEQLLESGDPHAVLEGWEDRSVTAERIVDLLGRSAALGLVLEKWSRSGLWVLARSHPDYPIKLKKRLGQESPSILIGCGDQRLLNTPSIAVVGSRDASEEDLQFTWDYGRNIAEGGYAVVSGGARGVDETAMLGCIDAGGKAVGILADSLLRAVTSAKYRNALATDQLTLVTPYNPEAGFNVGNAMSRNKYIYGCSEAAVIIASGKNKGGTWNGALEAMRSEWVPVWVRKTSSSPEGNVALVRRGAGDLGERMVSPGELASGQTNGDSAVPKSLFATSVNGDSVKSPPSEMEAVPIDPGATSPRCPKAIDDRSLFELFLLKLAKCTNDAPKSSASIAEDLGVSKAQAGVWLKKGTDEGIVKKSTRPTLYRASADTFERIMTNNSHPAVNGNAVKPD